MSGGDALYCWVGILLSNYRLSRVCRGVASILSYHVDPRLFGKNVSLKTSQFTVHTPILYHNYKSVNPFVWLTLSIYSV